MPFRFPLLALPRPPRVQRRPTLFAVFAALVAVCWLAASATASADTIPVASAELRIDEGEVLLNAEFEFSLNPTLEDALEKGIPLYFALDFELTRGRWYWLDEKVAQTALVYRVSYNALTRQYRVASGLLTQTFNSLEEVERFIGRADDRGHFRRKFQRLVRWRQIACRQLAGRRIDGNATDHYGSSRGSCPTR